MTLPTANSIHQTSIAHEGWSERVSSGGAHKSINIISLSLSLIMMTYDLLKAMAMPAMPPMSSCLATGFLFYFFPRGYRGHTRGRSENTKCYPFFRDEPGDGASGFAVPFELPALGRFEFVRSVDWHIVLQMSFASPAMMSTPDTLIERWRRCFACKSAGDTLNAVRR